MGNKRRIRIFLDTSALIAGIVSSKGAARELLRLAEAGLIDVVISRQVIVEADRNIEAKLRHMLADYRHYMKTLSPELLKDLPAKDIRKYARLINKDDAPILAAAEISGADYLITWDKKHFVTSKVKKNVKVKIVTPGEFLHEFREHLERLK
jgi:predicted nucleic acid-binding protein